MRELEGMSGPFLYNSNGKKTPACDLFPWATGYTRQIYEQLGSRGPNMHRSSVKHLHFTQTLPTLE